MEKKKNILIITGDAGESFEILYAKHRLAEEGYNSTVAAPTVAAHTVGEHTEVAHTAAAWAVAAPTADTVVVRNSEVESGQPRGYR